MLTRNVFLIGFAGSGKSTIGAKLAERLELPFHDTDAMIENDLRQSVAQAFEYGGEGHFRSCEADLIRKLCDKSQPASVVALGGGAFKARANRQRVLRSGLVIYLSCAVGELYKRLDRSKNRPLLNRGPRSAGSFRRERIERIKALLKERLPGYRAAHIRCATTNKTVDAVVSELDRRIRRHYAEGDY